MSSTAAVIPINPSRSSSSPADRWRRRYTSDRWAWSRRSRVRKALAVGAGLWTVISIEVQNHPQGIDAWFALSLASVLIWLAFMYALLQSTSGVLARRPRDLSVEQRTVRWRAHSITYRVLMNLFGMFVVSHQFAVAFVRSANLVVLSFSVAAIAAAWVSGETS